MHIVLILRGHAQRNRLPVRQDSFKSIQSNDRLPNAPHAEVHSTATPVIAKKTDIFGGAKPVDARKKMEEQEQKLKQEKEEEALRLVQERVSVEDQISEEVCSKSTTNQKANYLI